MGFAFFGGATSDFDCCFFFPLVCHRHTRPDLFFFFFSSASSSSPDPNLNLNPKPTSSSSSHPPPSSQQIQTSNIKPHQAHIIQPTFSPAVNERVENTVDGCVRDAVGQSGRYYCRKEGAGVMRGIQLRFEEGCCGHGMC